MKNDYKNINGLVVGLRSLLNKNDIKVGKWYKSGRIKGMSHFTGGAEVRSLWDCVEITVTSKGINVPTIEAIEEVLKSNEIEYTLSSNDYEKRIIIPAEKYCVKVRP